MNKGYGGESNEIKDFVDGYLDYCALIPKLMEDGSDLGFF